MDLLLIFFQNWSIEDLELFILIFEFSLELFISIFEFFKKIFFLPLCAI